jgi:endoglucanase
VRKSHVLLNLSCCAVITALSACGGSSTTANTSTAATTAATTGTSSSTSATGSTSSTSSTGSTGSTGSTTSGSSSGSKSSGSSTTGSTSSVTTTVPPNATTTSATVGAVTGISVSGNTLVDASGNKVQLHGVNVSALEAPSFSSDPWGGQDPNFAAMQKWGITVVRIPLAESNWLGLCSKSVSAGVTPAKYQSTVQTAVTQANAAGIYVILDLHEIAVPNTCPTGQNAMADTTYSATFWSQVATMFKGNQAVMFELFNEPQGPYPATTTSWANYLTGGLTGPQDVGINTLLAAVRATGATNVVLVDGLDYAADLSGFKAPVDTLNPAQIAAVQHYYNGDTYEAGANAVLASGLPILVTEYGDDSNATSDSDTVSLYGWADPGGRASQYLTAQGQSGASFPGVSYVAWAWDWGTGWYGGQGYNNWSLIQDAAGDEFTPGADPSVTGSTSTTPTAYAAEVKSHYLCRAAGTTTCQ